MSDLLKVLDFDDMPPSGVDLAAAVRAGRSRERRNLVVRVTAVAATALVVMAGVALAIDRRSAPRPAATPSRPWGCVAESVPPGRYVVDPTGEFVVTTPPRGAPATMRVHGGPPRELTGLPGIDPQPWRVNTAGMIIGASTKDGAVPGAATVTWTYRDGKLTILPAPADHPRVLPLAVNARGDVVGMTQRQLAGGAVNALILWPAAHPGTYQILRLPGAGTDMSASVILDDMTVLGTALYGANYDGVIWHPAGTPTRLDRPGITIDGADGDWMFGRFTTSELKGFRWNLRTGEFVDLGTFIPDWVMAGGRLAGTVLRDTQPAPAVWNAGTVELLQAPPSSGPLQIATAGGRVIYTNTGVAWRC